MQQELAQLDATRKDVETKMIRVRHEMREARKDARKARATFVHWRVFIDAAMACPQAWKPLSSRDKKRQCWCPHDDDDDDETMVIIKGPRSFFQLRPLDGCPKLVVCSWCRTWNAVGRGLSCWSTGNYKGHPGMMGDEAIGVDPEDYDWLWRDRLKAAADARELMTVEQLEQWHKEYMERYGMTGFGLAVAWYKEYMCKIIQKAEQRREKDARKGKKQTISSSSSLSSCSSSSDIYGEGDDGEDSSLSISAVK